MRILVTGGAGYIGSHTVALVRRAGHIVWVCDNLSTGHRAAVPAECLIECDLADRTAIERASRQHSIEAVVHFAAHCYVGESVRDPAKYYANNLVGTLSLLEAMRSAGVSRIVFSSTCATYGIPTRVPITEDEPQKPVNPYGFTKLAMERALADYAAAYGLGSVALRYFNAAGAAADGQLGEDHDPETHLIPLVLQTALGRRPHVEIFGADYPTPDGTCIRDYIHVEDLADAHLRALEHVRPSEFHAFNLGTGRGHSVREVIDVARRITGRAIPVIEAPRRSGDPPELVAAAEKARRLLGWQPHHTRLDTIIESAWRWHREHPHGFGTQTDSSL
jgi:UDP-glucose-4-epimerase GalE